MLCWVSLKNWGSIRWENELRLLVILFLYIIYVSWNSIKLFLWKNLLLQQNINKKRYRTFCRMLKTKKKTNSLFPFSSQAHEYRAHHFRSSSSSSRPHFTPEQHLSRGTTMQALRTLQDRPPRPKPIRNFLRLRCGVRRVHLSCPKAATPPTRTSFASAKITSKSRRKRKAEGAGQTICRVWDVWCCSWLVIVAIPCKWSGSGHIHFKLCTALCLKTQVIAICMRNYVYAG